MTLTPRFRLVLVPAAVLALVLAACGGGDDTSSAGGGGGGGGGGGPEEVACPVDALDSADGPVEVVAWHTQTARPLTSLEKLVADYNDSQSKVRVRLESQGASYVEIQRKFNQAVASQELPALIMVDDTFTRSMADSGVILPAQACFDASGESLGGLVDTARSYYTLDGDLWPASAGLGNVLLYYNRNHFRRAGLDPDDPPRTLAEVREAAEAIRAAGVAESPFVHELASWKTEFWLTGAGSSVVNNDNGRGDEATAATLGDNPEALELFTWFDEMESDGLMQAVTATPGQVDQYVAMATQSASMLIDTSSAATSIEAFLAGDLDPSEVTPTTSEEEIDLEQLDLAAGPLPGLGAPGRTQMGGAAWYMTNTASDEVQAGAWDFMRFMNSPQAQAEMLVGGSYLPWVESALTNPRVEQYFAGDAGLAGTWLELANDEIADIDPDFPGPLIGPYDEFREVLEKAQDDLVFGGASPDDVLATAQTDVTKALERYSEENF